MSPYPIVVMVRMTTQKAFQVYIKGESEEPISKILIANPNMNVEKMRPMVRIR